MQYEDWKKELRNKLVEIGFSKDEADRKATNYRGLFIDEGHDEGISDVIDRIMARPIECFMLPESVRDAWAKKKGRGDCYSGFACGAHLKFLDADGVEKKRRKKTTEGGKRLMYQKLKDSEERGFREETEMMRFFMLQKRKDRWLTPSVETLQLEELENAPIVLEDVKERHHIESLSDEAVTETMGGSGLLLSYVSDGKREYMPVRETAVSSLCERAGLDGRAIKHCYKHCKSVLAALLNEGFNLWDKESKVLVRDEKISAVHSNAYAVMPTFDLLSTLHEALKDIFGGYELESCTTSHRYTYCTYRLNNSDDIMRILNRAMRRSGHEELTGVPLLGFTTSDTASSGANIYPYILCEGLKMRIGDPITMKHMGEKNTEQFKDNCQDIFSLYSHAADQLEALAEVKIDYPRQCLVSVAKRLGLPTAATKEISDDMEMEWEEHVTALDIYTTLWKVVATIKTDSKESALNNQEKVARAIHLDYKSYDFNVSI